jgi:hypothetical protein
MRVCYLTALHPETELGPCGKCGFLGHTPETRIPYFWYRAPKGRYGNDLKKNTYFFPLL